MDGLHSEEIGGGQSDTENSESERRRKVRADWDAWREIASKSVSPEVALLTDEDIVRMVHESREEIAIEKREKAK